MLKLVNNKQPWRLRLKQTLSVLTTFYISYLFLHFVILELTPIENTFVIVAIIWLGHILLNLVMIATMKKQTFGDVLFCLQYNPLKREKSSGVAIRLLMRSLLTNNILYLLICLNVQMKFSMSVLLSSFCFGLFLLVVPVKRQAFQTLNLFDRVSGIYVR